MGRARKIAAAPSRIIPPLLRLLRASGVDLDALLSRMGLPRDAEHADEVPVTPETFEALLATGVDATGDDTLALGLPARLQAPTYNLGELAAQASPTVREAFARVARYAPLFYAHLAYECRARGDTLVVEHHLRSGGRGARYSNEYAIASTLFHVRRISGVHIVPQRVYFAHHAPPDLAPLHSHFGTEDVAFDRARSGMVLAAADVDRAAVGADPRLLRTAERLAERALERGPLDFVAAVEAQLRDAVRAGPPSAPAVARGMHLSTRTLQRRLDESGVTFSALVDGVRKEVALEAARDPALSVAELGARVGFADAAAFGRAFKRWTGTTPGRFRGAAK